ncbi:peptidoglycan DD-metalloendopeptidase family protein [Nocardioides salsibiostraticola]
MALPLANAAEDDLKDRRNSVQSRIEKVNDDLEMASDKLRLATKKASIAEASLSGAQARLQKAQNAAVAARARLAEARERDQLLQVALETATANLEGAQADLKAGRIAVKQQQADVADEVATVYEQGAPQLLALSALLNSESLDDVVRTQTTQDAIVGHGERVYSALQDAEDVLAAKEKQVAEARAEVKAQREDAAANLLEIDALNDATVNAKDAVRGLVDDRRSVKQTALEARQEAAAAREEDRQMIADLKQREQRIKQLILDAASQDDNVYDGATGGLLNYPVNGRITSPYGYRVHPIYGYYGLHDGTDFGAGCGSSLLASANGTVVQRYYDSVYGNRLYINVGRVNGANLTLVYNHAAGYNVGIGDKVRRGQRVGSVGDTGWSTGCHLHFTVLKNGNAVNPENYF